MTDIFPRNGVYLQSQCHCRGHGEYGSYWTETETYESLKVYIDLDLDGSKEWILSMQGGGS